MSSALRFLFVALLSLAMADISVAAKHSSFAQSDGDEGRSSGGGARQMMADVSLNYIRNTQPDGKSDTAGKVSVGGMFNHWLGLDILGMYGVRTNNYLVGADFRLVPTEWLFMKGGIGGYSDKVSGTFKSTPIFGAGINARIDRSYYVTTEATYFQVSSANNIGVGVGLGIYF